MKKLFTLLLSMVVLVGLSAKAQNVDVQVQLISVERTGYGDCGVCGSPDPTWKTSGTTNGAGGTLTTATPCVHIDDMGGTTSSGYTNQILNHTSSSASTVTLGLDAWEKNCTDGGCSFSGGAPFGPCWSAFNDNNRCNSANVLVINFRNDPNCQWNNYTTSFCGSYRYTVRVWWNWSDAPTMVTQPAANTSLCSGSTNLTVAVNSGSPGGTLGKFFQWQISENTSGAGSGWTDIPGATSATYATQQIAGTRMYRCKITSNCTADFTSNTVTSNPGVVTYQPMNGTTSAAGTVPYRIGDNPPAVQSGICGISVLPGSVHTLNTLQPPNVDAVANLTGYLWSATGGSFSSTTASSTNWTAPTTTGTYTITAQYQSSCGNYNSAGCAVTVVAPNCDFAYVSPTGSDVVTAGGPSNPYASVGYAVSQLGARTYIRVLEGTYSQTSIINIPSNVAIEGGYRITGGQWNKNSAAVTTINFSAAATEAPDANSSHNVGFKSVSTSGWTLQDLTITTAAASGTASSGRGKSNYGIHLNGASNYNIVRCNITAGAATQGASGTNGSTGHTGAGGGAGQSASCNDGGKTGGAGATTASNAWGNNGGNGGNGGNSQGNGGATNAGAPGAAGVGSGGGAAGAAGTNGGGNCGTNSTGGNAGAGGGFTTTTVSTAGANGGTAGITESYGLYYVPSGQGTQGGHGNSGGGGGGGGASRGQSGSFISCLSNGGNAGGGGGKGGGGGEGGTGGFGGGGSFGIYRNASNTGANLTDVIVAGGAAGAGGTGGTGGDGGPGGAGGNGPADCSGERGNAGDGGAGGNGARGGSGQTGAAGVSNQMMVVGTGSSNPTTSIPNPTTVTVDYGNTKGCINSEITLTKAAGSWALPSGLTFVNNVASGSSSHLAANNTVVVTTATAAVYDITANGGVYNDYLRVIDNARPVPTITVTPTTMCAGGTFGLTAGNLYGTTAGYDWRLFTTDATGPLQSSTNAAPSFTVVAAGTYNIRLRVNEQCCGWSNPVYTSIVVAADPSAPSTLTKTVASNQTTVCSGATGLSVNAAAGSTGGAPTCNYEYSFINTTGTWSTWSTSIPSITAGVGPGTVKVKARRNCSGQGCDISAETAETEWEVVEDPLWATITVTPTTLQCQEPVYLGAAVNGGLGGTITFVRSTTSMGAGTTVTSPDIPSPGSYFYRPQYAATGLGCNLSDGTETAVTMTSPINPGFKTWVGYTDTNWHVDDNWDCYGVPISSDRVIIPATPLGGNNPIVLTGNTADCFDVEVRGNTVDLLQVQDGAILNVTQP